MVWARKRKMNKKRSGMKRKGGRRGYKTVNVVGRSLNPIPQKMIAKHKYADVATISLVSSALGNYNFNLNSVWDPNRTGSGHQPYGRDTFATIYNRYRVLGCYYNVSLVPSSAALATQLLAIPANEEVSGTVTSASAGREQPRCRYILQAPVGAGAPIKNLKGYVDIASLMGLTKTQYRSNENTQAQVGASPTELAILNLFAGTFTEDIITTSIYVSVEMTYVVEWFDPLILSQS